MRTLAGQNGRMADVLAVGIGTTAAAVGDAKLHFEAERVNIDLSVPDFINDAIIFKATLPQEFVAKIYEVGAFLDVISESASDASSVTLVTFDSETEEWSPATWNTTNNRIGIDALRLTAAASATTTSTWSNVAYDLSQYAAGDTFLIAFNSDANTSSVEVRFKTDASNYYRVTQTNPTTGYNILSFPKSSWTAVGSPSWANITIVEVVVVAKAAGTTNVDMDAVRIEDIDTLSTSSTLISRTVLGTPITKTNTSPMDIEYTLEVTFS